MNARTDPSLIDFVIYHENCNDGFGAAYAAWKFLGNKATYYPAKHGEPPPDIYGRHVVILDFSYDNKTTKKMLEDASSLTIIDHHKSAMIELHDIAGAHFDMTHSGASLAWDFFHPGKESPKFISYIEDRDLWKWELPYSREFAVAFDMVPFEFEEYEKYEDASVFDDAVKRGSYILAYTKNAVKKICDDAIPKRYGQYSILVINSSHWMSEIGAKLAPSCDFAAIWYFDHDKKQSRVSLRSFHDHIDVSEIAKKFGGGGHKKAAGFFLPCDVHIDDVFYDPGDFDNLEPDDASTIPVNLVKNDEKIE